jgi:phage RecT family recombinase
MMNDLAVNVENAVTEAAGQFASTLSQYKWDLLPDSQLYAAKQALTKSDYIMKIAAGDPSAVHSSLVQSAILGLDLTEGKRQGWLLPRKNQNGKTVIHLQVGYKGVEAIHQRMGVIDRLVIRVVRENDEFEWSGDDAEKPRHEAKPSWFANDEERGKISGAFAITYFPDGSINVVTAPITDIFEKHRDRSESYKSYKAKTDKGEWAYEPPWVSDEKSMVEKTMAYIAAKQWPANIRDEGQSSKILETLHETDIADYNYTYTQDQKDAFNDFVENKDSLGMYLFTKRVDTEVYLALFMNLKKSFPKGQKVKLKNEFNEFVQTGGNQFFEVVRGIEDFDSALIQENIEGCPEITLKLLKSMLDDNQKKVLDELLEQSEAIEN